MKWFYYIDFGSTLVFAETLGWIDPDDDAFPDEIEQDALNYIRSRGYGVVPARLVRPASGPWTENACEVQAADGTPICEMLCSPDDSGVNYPFASVADANSRLICAAPDMLAVLHEIKRWYDTQRNITSAPWIHTLTSTLKNIHGE